MKEKPKILVADDEDRNLRLMEAMLAPQGYEIILAVNGLDALEKAKASSPDVILLDVMMPLIDGFEVARRLKEDEATSIIPIVMVTALREVQDRVKALEFGADDLLSKPVERTELRARVQSLLKVKAYNDHMLNHQAALEAEVAKRTKQLRKAFQQVKSASLETIHRLSRAAEHRDESTGTHIMRVSNYAAAVARQLDQDEEIIEAILYAAPMHDIGKIGTPDHILLKPGKLTPDEWETMKQHTTIGARILEGSKAKFIRLAEVIARSHHEKWDGSGYPDGLSGTDIPLAARITTIVDVFDALLSKRPYKEAYSLEKSFNIIEQQRGKHFDPDIVDAFFAAKDDLLTIKKNFEV